MKINIPMKARKSNRSWAPSKVGSSASRLRLFYRLSHMRYFFSIALFAISLSAVIVGASGMMTENASAQESREGYLTQLFRQLRERQQRPEETPVVQEVPPPAPVEPNVVQSPVVTPAQSSLQFQLPSSNAVTVQAPAAVDTSPSITTMTQAQAAAESEPIAYTSQQISTENRDRLWALSAMAAASGIVLYLLSLINAGSTKVGHAAGVRYRIPVREVITR